MKKNWFNIAIIGCLSISLMGCNLFSDPNAPNNATHSPTETVQFTGTQTAFVSPTQGDSTPMTPANPTPTTSSLENLIQMAKEDLAQHLSVPVSEINLVEVNSVVWPDSSLGCPQEGMVYAQVLTPGYLILLRHSGTTFEYHTSTGNYVVTCENPSPPVTGEPDNT